MPVQTLNKSIGFLQCYRAKIHGPQQVVDRPTSIASAADAQAYWLAWTVVSHVRKEKRKVTGLDTRRHGICRGVAPI